MLLVETNKIEQMFTIRENVFILLNTYHRFPSQLETCTIPTIPLWNSIQNSCKLWRLRCNLAVILSLGFGIVNYPVSQLEDNLLNADICNVQDQLDAAMHLYFIHHNLDKCIKWFIKWSQYRVIHVLLLEKAMQLILKRSCPPDRSRTKRRYQIQVSCLWAPWDRTRKTSWSGGGSTGVGC